MAAAELPRCLAFNGIRVSELTRDAVQEGTTYPRGTWVIPMNQEFAELARQVLEPQVYPDRRESPDGPPEQPYDAAGWTLPFQMDVRGQPLGTFRVVFNSALLGGDLSAGKSFGAAGFWTTPVADKPKP